MKLFRAKQDYREEGPLKFFHYLLELIKDGGLEWHAGAVLFFLAYPDLSGLLSEEAEILIRDVRHALDDTPVEASEEEVAQLLVIVERTERELRRRLYP